MSKTTIEGWCHSSENAGTLFFWEDFNDPSGAKYRYLAGFVTQERGEDADWVGGIPVPVTITIEVHE